MQLLRRAFFVAALSCSFSFSAFAQGFDHSALDTFLKKFVAEDGRINYAAAKKDRANLDLYLEKVKNVDLKALESGPKAELLAFWLNVYHAALISFILENYPIRSTQDVPDFWQRQFLAVGGDSPSIEKVSLADIRQNHLVSEFKDEKINLVLALAAQSGPVFPREVYVGARVLGQIFKKVRFEMNRPGWFEVSSDKKKVKLNRVFEWYGPDFELNFKRPEHRGVLSRTDTSVINFIVRYLRDYEVARFLKTGQYKIEYLQFNWDLNDQYSA